jgi:hypothetical protein
MRKTKLQKLIFYRAPSDVATVESLVAAGWTIKHDNFPISVLLEKEIKR